MRKYLQDYELAISGYRRAQELDPGLPAAQAAEDVQRFMHRVASLVARKVRFADRGSHVACIIAAQYEGQCKG